MHNQITKRKQQAIETKKRIFDAAIKLINKKGFENISISEICKSAKCSVGSFYHYFESKDDLIMSAYKDADYQAEEVIRRIPPQGDFKEQILYIFTVQSEIAQKLGVQFMTQIYKNQITIDNHFLFAKTRVMPNHIRLIIEKAQQEGVLTSEYSSEFIANELMKFSRGLFYDWCALKGSYNHTEAIKKSMSIFISAFYR
jgi:TetR/AcrR family fatty acid metabolism transcriptional regulator